MSSHLSFVVIVLKSLLFTFCLGCSVLLWDWLACGRVLNSPGLVHEVLAPPTPPHHSHCTPQSLGVRLKALGSCRLLSWGQHCAQAFFVIITTQLPYLFPSTPVGAPGPGQPPSAPPLLAVPLPGTPFPPCLLLQAPPSCCPGHTLLT